MKTLSVGMKLYSRHYNTVYIITSISDYGTWYNMTLDNAGSLLYHSDITKDVYDSEYIDVTGMTEEQITKIKTIDKLKT